MMYHSLLLLSFFVPDLQNENDSPEDLKRKWTYRSKHWEDVVKQQFQLAYFGKVSYEESQDMTIHEREFIFGLLLDQKSEEKKAHEDAIKASEAKARNK